MSKPIRFSSFGVEIEVMPRSVVRSLGILSLLCTGFALAVMTPWYPVVIGSISDLVLGIPEAARGALALATFSGLGFLALQYLNVSRSDSDVDGVHWVQSSSQAELDQLAPTIAALSRDLESLKAAQLEALAGNREELIEALKPTMQLGLADELQQRFSADALKFSRTAEIRRTFSGAQQRLQVELGALSRRSNLNLVIGVLTTGVAVVLLIYLVLGGSENYASLTLLLSHYLPRLTVVIFIEVFSFFFLRLYRATLAEMRLYQADLTLLAIQQVAVEAALSAPDPDAASFLSKELLSQRQPAQANPTTAREITVDPEVVADVLQRLAKAVIPKQKGD